MRVIFDSCDSVIDLRLEGTTQTFMRLHVGRVNPFEVSPYVQSLRVLGDLAVDLWVAHASQLVRELGRLTLYCPRGGVRPPAFQYVSSHQLVDSLILRHRRNHKPHGKFTSVVASTTRPVYLTQLS
jgi:hypothetical protein